MSEKLPLTLVFIAVLAFACGPRPREAGADSATVKRSASADTPLAAALDVRVANGVEFAFQVANEGSKKLELLFPDGRTHDVVVLDSIGREVWRWSDGRMFTQAVQNKVLRSNDALTFEQQWPSPRPGRYMAVATLASRNYPVEHRVEFVVQ